MTRFGRDTGNLYMQEYPSFDSHLSTYTHTPALQILFQGSWRLGRSESRRSLSSFPQTCSPATGPCSSTVALVRTPLFTYIQKMKDLGITSGCGTTTYCPDDAVTRGQMAVILLRARPGGPSRTAF